MNGSGWIIISTLIVAAATAQETPLDQQQVQAEDEQNRASELSHPRSFLRNFAAEEYRIWTSPFRSASYDAHAVKKYVIPFALISSAMIATDTRTDVWTDSPTLTRWSGRVSQMGAGYTLAGFSGATFLIGHITKNDHLQETGLLALEALAHAQVVAFGMKQITNRTRPADDKQQMGFWKGGDAFPSGHAMTSFSMAAVFAYEYRDHLAVPITAYALASIVSVSRASAQRHWLSDVFVGGSTGFLIGRYVYKRHHDPELPGSPIQKTSWMPDIGIGRSGVALAWRL
jgi:membrane-associated phospholipid phosphatase